MAVFKHLNIRDKTNANRLILNIDSREPSKMEVNASKLGYPTNVLALNLKNARYSFGDYLIGVKNRFAMIGERKTIADIVGSMWDKRFYRQLKYMEEVAEELRMIPILFLTGSIREYRSKERRRIKRAFQSGKIKKFYEPPSISNIEDNITEAHVKVLSSCPSMIIRHVVNDIQMLRAIYKYASDIGERRIGGFVPRAIIEDKKIAFQISTVATLFNLNEYKAKNVILNYENFESFIETATEGNLVRNVKGIGKLNAQLIMKRIGWLKR